MASGRLSALSASELLFLCRKEEFLQDWSEEPTETAHSEGLLQEDTLHTAFAPSRHRLDRHEKTSGQAA